MISYCLAIHIFALFTYSLVRLLLRMHTWVTQLNCKIDMNLADINIYHDRSSSPVLIRSLLRWCLYSVFFGHYEIHGLTLIHVIFVFLCSTRFKFSHQCDLCACVHVCPYAQNSMQTQWERWCSTMFYVFLVHLTAGVCQDGWGDAERLTVAVLKDWLKNQGVANTGKKQELLERVRSCVWRPFQSWYATGVLLCVV